jgi:hypothetical protein
MNPSTELSSGETKARITEMLRDLSSFYRGEVDAKTYRAYAPKLCGIPLDILQEALDRCSDELKFFPLVPEIKERVAAIRAERTRHSKDLAWEKLTAKKVCSKCFNNGNEIILDEQGRAIGARPCMH